jgi:hypothetical protein
MLLALGNIEQYYAEENFLGCGRQAERKTGLQSDLRKEGNGMKTLKWILQKREDQRCMEGAQYRGVARGFSEVIRSVFSCTNCDTVGRITAAGRVALRGLRIKSPYPETFKNVFSRQNVAKYLIVIFDRRITWRIHIQTTEAKAFRTFLRVYPLIKSERLNVNIKLTLHY